MNEYVSYEVSKEVNNILGKYYSRIFHRYTEECWRYPVAGSGGHASSHFIDDFYQYDDPFSEDDDTCFAFTWEELNKLMNAVVLGDYRKTEFESIIEIDQFALALKEYLEEQERKEDR